MWKKLVEQIGRFLIISIIASVGFVVVIATITGLWSFCQEFVKVIPGICNFLITSVVTNVWVLIIAAIVIIFASAIYEWLHEKIISGKK